MIQIQSEIQAELISYIKQRNKRKSRKLIKNAIDGINEELTSEEFFDLIGQALITDQGFFMDKVYPKIYPKLQYKFSRKNLSILESAIMEKYTLYSNESILKSFNGKIVQNDNQVKGNIYITEYRLIAHGKFGPTALSSFGAAAAGSSGSGDSNYSGSGAAVGLAINDYMQNSIRKKIQASMGEKFGQKYCFGYHYPLMDAYRINRKKKSIKYQITIKVDKTFGSGKKDKRLKIKIKPYEKRNEILTFLENKLK